MRYTSLSPDTQSCSFCLDDMLIFNFTFMQYAVHVVKVASKLPPQNSHPILYVTVTKCLVMFIICCIPFCLSRFQNDLQEFYSIVEFCNPGVLGELC